jgi:hypothetical protein
MDNNVNTDPQKDEKLWALAKKRFEFKKHLVIYVTVNVFLWAVWFFTSSKQGNFIPWPAYVTVGWGIGLAFQYVTAYSQFKDAMINKDYQKLKNKLNS